MADITVEVIKTVNDIILEDEVVIVEMGTAGPQGPRGSMILNGEGEPSMNLGIIGDFYIDTLTQEMYGPKNKDDWGNVVDLVTNEELGYVHIQHAQSNEWVINHGLGFIPNITVVDSEGVVVEGSYDYSEDGNTVTARFTQIFSGKAYLS
jgi:hypothetical protein